MPPPFFNWMSIMQCYRPLAAYKNRLDGSISFSGSSLVGDMSPLKLPCGQCTGCRLEQSRQWAVRIMHETKMHEENCFITLTYETEPEFGTLVKKDLTDFFKRLRKRLDPIKIRYFACGEYGEKTLRPHYHAIIFGTAFSQDKKLYKNGRHPLYNSEILCKAWPHGHAVFGDATFESAAYVARYCLKKIMRKDEDYEVFYDLQTGEIISRIPEYAVMSRRPGIGQAFYDKYADDITRTDRVIMRGKAMLPPRYYDKLLEKTDPVLFSELKDSRIAGQQPTVHSTLSEELRSRQAERAKFLYQSAIAKRT